MQERDLRKLHVVLPPVLHGPDHPVSGEPLLGRAALHSRGSLLRPGTPYPTPMRPDLTVSSYLQLNSYNPAAHSPVYIGVYGYKASKFSIIVSG